MQRATSPEWSVSMLPRGGGGGGGGGGRGNQSSPGRRVKEHGYYREQEQLLGPSAISPKRTGGPRPRGTMIICALGLLLLIASMAKTPAMGIWDELTSQPTQVFVSLVQRMGEVLRHRKRDSDTDDEEEEDKNDSTQLAYVLARNLEAKLAIGLISGSGLKQRHRIATAQATWVTSLDHEKDGLLVFSDTTNVTIPTIGLSGTDDSWAGAQERWLPALAHLYLSFPSADWFVLADDDTFLVPANFKAMLAKNDASKPWYLGRAMFVEPQRGPLAEGKNKGGLQAFAHGGSATALSSGLMEAFDPHLEEALNTGVCTGATGYGDGDLGLCLHHFLNVMVTHEACLHSSGPEDFKNMSDGFFAQVDQPCSFHYAFRGAASDSGAGRDRDEEGGGKEGSGVEGMEKMWNWHRLYNLGEKRVDDEEEEEAGEGGKRLLLMNATNEEEGVEEEEEENMGLRRRQGGSGRRL